MGFFSQQCHGCDHSILSVYSTSGINDWMRFAVAITPDGDIHSGEYDGYGRIGGADYAVGGGNTVWHRACWKQARCPMDFQGESPWAGDQGFFFDDGDHDMPEPRVS